MISLLLKFASSISLSLLYEMSEFKDLTYS